MTAMRSYFDGAGGTPPTTAADDEGLARFVLWQAYCEKMPREKIDALSSAMRWDLEMLRSARIKLTS